VIYATYKGDIQHLKNKTALLRILGKKVQFDGKLIRSRDNIPPKNALASIF
jgi:hypothetical protein